MTHNRWMWMTLCATLVIGVGVGILFDRVVLERAVHSDSASRPERTDHDNRARRFREHLQRELDLTPEQAERLEAVLGKNHETAHEFWEASRREFDALRQQFRHDIRDVLTEEQKARFDELLAEHEAARKRRD